MPSSTLRRNGILLAAILLAGLASAGRIHATSVDAPTTEGKDRGTGGSEPAVRHHAAEGHHKAGSAKHAESTVDLVPGDGDCAAQLSALTRKAQKQEELIEAQKKLIEEQQAKLKQCQCR